jgi:hypothetical protein
MAQSGQVTKGAMRVCRYQDLSARDELLLVEQAVTPRTLPGHKLHSPVHELHVDNSLHLNNMSVCC